MRDAPLLSKFLGIEEQGGKGVTVREQRVVVWPGVGEKKHICAKASVVEVFELSVKTQLRMGEAIAWKNLEGLAGARVPLGFSDWNFLWYFWKCPIRSACANGG